jgi:two-component system nitrate/nitrite response regulator NarL
VAGDQPALRVVIVDDHPLSLHALRAFVGRAGHDVVGGARDIAAGTELIRRLRPRVAIVDLTLPDGSGLELIRAVRDVSGLRVLVHTGTADAQVIEEALAAGVAGITSKASAIDVLLEAVLDVAAGRFYIDEAMKAELAAGRPPAPTLTPREREILQMIAQGLSLEEVALRLVVSPETVRTHLSNARRKLGARNRTEAVVAAMRSAQIRMPEAS